LPHADDDAAPISEHAAAADAGIEPEDDSSDPATTAQPASA
jgi:hypothetical protein